MLRRKEQRKALRMASAGAEAAGRGAAPRADNVVPPAREFVSLRDRECNGLARKLLRGGTIEAAISANRNASFPPALA